MIVRVANTVAACGRSIPKETNSELRPFARPRPRNSPTTEASSPDHERFDHHRAQHLAACGPERAQRGKFSRALSDRDRERVGDHEAADEQRDPAEREQEVLDDAEEAVGFFRRIAAPALRRVRTCAFAGSSGRISLTSRAGE